MRLRATRIPLAGFATLALLALVPACSNTSNTPGTTPSSTSTSQTKHGAFGECLREHGVTQPPGPPVGGPPAGPPPGPTPDHSDTPPPPAGVDQGTWDNAMQACGSLAPARPGGSH
jgi:hypothetical protein